MWWKKYRTRRTFRGENADRGYTKEELQPPKVAKQTKKATPNEINPDTGKSYLKLPWYEKD